MSNKSKDLRNQVKNVIKEMLPTVLASEAYIVLATKIQKDNQEALNAIHKMVRDTLDRIDERQKTVQSLVMREISQSKAVQSDSEPYNE